jgi:hypothetical protein
MSDDIAWRALGAAKTAYLRTLEAQRTFQALTASQAQAGHQIARDSSDILVVLTEDLTATGTSIAPISPERNDRITARRQGLGEFNWNVIGETLRYRDDVIVFQWTGTAWQVMPLTIAARKAARRVSGGGTLVANTALDRDASLFFVSATTYDVPDATGASSGFQVRLWQRGSGVVSLTLGAGLTHSSGPTATTVDGSMLLVAAAGNSQIVTQLYLPAGGGGAGDAAPTVVETTATPHSLEAAQRLAFNVSIYAHADSVDFEVPAASVEGSWIVHAYDEDDGTARAGCTVSVAGDAGSVNGSAGVNGIREIVAGGFAVVSVINPAGNSPIVKVTGDIFEPAVSRGATNPVTKADHRKEFQITGTQTFGEAATYPSGFRAVYWASGADRSLVGPGPGTFVILNGGAAMVYKKADGSLVAQGVPASGSGLAFLDPA